MSFESELGLPSPWDVLDLNGDTLFAHLYMDFLRGLVRCNGVIGLAENDFFTRARDEVEEAAATRLLACLLQADEQLIDTLFGSLVDLGQMPVVDEDGREIVYPVDPRRWTWPELFNALEDPGFREDFFYYAWHGGEENREHAVRQIRNFLAATAMPEYRLFAEGRAAPVVDVAFGVLIGGMMMQSVIGVQVVRMNVRWSILLAEHVSLFGLLPVFAGFVRNEHLVEDITTLGGRLSFEGDVPLLWTDHIEWYHGLDARQREDIAFVLMGYEPWDFGNLQGFIEPLTRDELRTLASEPEEDGADRYGYLRDVLERLYEFLTQEAGIDPYDAAGTARPLYEKYGRPQGLLWFEELLETLEGELEEAQEAEAQENPEHAIDNR